MCCSRLRGLITDSDLRQIIYQMNFTTEFGHVHSLICMVRSVYSLYVYSPPPHEYVMWTFINRVTNSHVTLTAHARLICGWKSPVLFMYEHTGNTNVATMICTSQRRISLNIIWFTDAILEKSVFQETQKGMTGSWPAYWFVLNSQGKCSRVVCVSLVWWTVNTMSLWLYYYFSVTLATEVYG